MTLGILSSPTFTWRECRSASLRINFFFCGLMIKVSCTSCWDFLVCPLCSMGLLLLIIEFRYFSQWKCFGFLWFLWRGDLIFIVSVRTIVFGGEVLYQSNIDFLGVLGIFTLAGIFWNLNFTSGCLWTYVADSLWCSCLFLLSSCFCSWDSVDFSLNYDLFVSLRLYILRIVFMVENLCTSGSLFAMGVMIFCLSLMILMADSDI